jgi:hypothetical protein
MLINFNDRLPVIGSYNDLEDPDEAISLMKFVDNETGQIWYPTEFDGRDSFYGFVMEKKYHWIRSYEFDWAWGQQGDWDSFKLSSLLNKGSVVRDYDFKPCTIATVVADSEIFRIDQEKTGAFLVSCNGYCISSNIPNIKLAITMVEKLGELHYSSDEILNIEDLMGMVN